MNLAVYGLAAMVAKHNKTRGEQLVLQAISGHMRKLLAALPETESLNLVQTGKVYRRLEDLILKRICRSSKDEHESRYRFPLAATL